MNTVSHTTMNLRLETKSISMIPDTMILVLLGIGRALNVGTHVILQYTLNFPTKLLKIALYRSYLLGSTPFV